MDKLDPRLYGVDNSGIYEWRQYLKKELLKQCKYRSYLSGKPLYKGCHMHEGIISRAMVPKSIWWHYMIFHPYNSFLLLPEEHIPQPPDREWCIEYAYQRYGRDKVLEWIDSLPFKVKPYLY